MGVWCIHHIRCLTSIAMFTTSQGFFIFIFFCVIGKEGRELWINLLCCGCKLPSTPLYKKSGGEGYTGMQNNPMKLLKLSSMYFCSPSTTSSMQNVKIFGYLCYYYVNLKSWKSKMTLESSIECICHFVKEIIIIPSVHMH